MSHHIVVRAWEKGAPVSVAPDTTSGVLDRGGVLWVDVSADGSSWEELRSDLEPVLDRYSGALERRLLEAGGSPPKVRILDDGTLAVRAYAMRVDGVLRSAEVHAVAGERFLLTIRYHEHGDGLPDVPHEMPSRLDAASSRVTEGGGFHLLYVLLDELVDDYLEMVEVFDEMADALEDRVFVQGEPGESGSQARERHAGLQRDILRLKRELGDFRRRLLPFGEIRELAQEELRRDPEGRSEFREVEEAVLRVVELTDNVRDLLTASFEAELAQVSNETNEIMKRVTSWAAILLVPTLIAGIYGMNFRHMPELGWGLGYPGALGLMGLSAAGLYLLFRRNGWM